jgi:hypothetical protein
VLAQRLHDGARRDHAQAKEGRELGAVLVAEKTVPRRLRKEFGISLGAGVLGLGAAHLVLRYGRRVPLMKVPIDTLERNSLSSSVRESRLAVSGPGASRVLGLERVLERRQEQDENILDTLRIQILAVTGVSLVVSEGRERLQLGRHLEGRSTEGTESFDALAEGCEDVGSLRDGEGEVTSVDERRCVDEGEGDASRREEGLEATLDGDLFGAELRVRTISLTSNALKLLSTLTSFCRYTLLTLSPFSLSASTTCSTIFSILPKRTSRFEFLLLSVLRRS